jgi:hypothetical protein
MGAEVYEIGLFKPSAVEEGSAVMIPRTWDARTLLKSIPWLRLQNADGRNIYVRPKGEHELSLVDDLTADAVRRMKASGFAPALVVETSPENFQTWLKHPRPLPRELSTLAARRLAEEFGGDPGAADWRHFGRLSGLTNRKPKYMSERGLFPFVRLIEATGMRYAEGERVVSAVSKEYEAKMRTAESQRRTRLVNARQHFMKTINDFRSDQRYGGDATREDLAFAIYAVSHGADSQQIAASLQSRDLSHKGDSKRQQQYVERTIAKARTLGGGHNQELEPNGISRTEEDRRGR